MDNITFFNCSKRNIKRNIKFLENYTVNVINEQIENRINRKILLDKNDKLYEEYIRLIYLYENPSLLFDGNFKLIKEINYIPNKINFFLCYGTTNEISTRVMGNFIENNEIIKNIILEIEKISKSKLKNVSEEININNIISKVLNINVNDYINTLVKKGNYLIFPYEYFFSVDYENIGKDYSENTVAILVNDKKISLKKKIKQYCFNIIGAPAYKYLSTLISSMKNKKGIDKFNKQQVNGTVCFKNQTIKTSLNAIEELKKEKYTNIDYIIFHNPNWLGVTSSTKELFENLIPLQELYNDNIINDLSDEIVKRNIKQVIFSSFTDGWAKFAISIKQKNKNIKIKVFWHASNSQIIEPIKINWRTNKQIVSLHKEGIIDVFATCKESIINFYKSQGYTTHFVKNTVRLVKSKCIDKKEDVSLNRSDTSIRNPKIKVGLYAAGNDWRKNMFNQIAALSMFEDIEVESIPLNYDGQVFASRNNLKIDGSSTTIKRENLLEKMSSKDINLYVTFSECAPMLPIESLELGVPCITGNNHHYFKNTKLQDYLVVNREDDITEIYNKILLVLKNKEEIMEIYRNFKKEYDKESKKSVEEFLEM